MPPGQEAAAAPESTNVVRWAAFDARTGKRLGPPRFTQSMAQKDADKQAKRGFSAVTDRISA